MDDRRRRGACPAAILTEALRMHVGHAMAGFRREAEQGPAAPLVPDLFSRR